MATQQTMCEEVRAVFPPGSRLYCNVWNAGLCLVEVLHYNNVYSFSIQVMETPGGPFNPSVGRVFPAEEVESLYHAIHGGRSHFKLIPELHNTPTTQFGDDT